MLVTILVAVHIIKLESDEGIVPILSGGYFGGVRDDLEGGSNDLDD